MARLSRGPERNSGPARLEGGEARPGEPRGRYTRRKKEMGENRQGMKREQIQRDAGGFSQRHVYRSEPSLVDCKAVVGKAPPTARSRNTYLKTEKKWSVS